MTPERVLVTGGAGYIGSHTVIELINHGYEVIIVDNLSNSSPSVISRLKDITGKMVSFTNLDLRNKQALKAFFKRSENIQAVIHFAAMKSVNESVGQPLAYYENNIQGTINLLEAMLENKVRSMVFSSSCTVYGSPDNLPVTEASPLGHTPSPYGYTKQVCERLIQDATLAYPGLKAISLRYFNPIGAHPSGKIGELPLGTPENLVPYITQTAAGIREQLTVFGDDYDTKDGSCIRDYIHVVDLAEAHVRSLDWLGTQTKASALEVFNVGTGQGVSVLEAVKAFEKASGKPLNYKVGDRRPGDIVQIYADASKAKNLLGWSASRDIHESMKDAWNWQKNLSP